MDIKINHVALSVNNIEESIKWYTQKLGFALVDQYKNASMEIARVRLGSVTLELIKVVENAQALPDYRKNLQTDLQVIGTKHLCLEVSDLNKVLTGLKANEIEIIGELDTTYFGGTFIFIKDCNGILIELYQP